MSLQKEWKNHVFPKNFFIGASNNTKSCVVIERDEDNKWRFCGVSTKKKTSGELKQKEWKVSLSKAKECIRLYKINQK